MNGKTGILVPLDGSETAAAAVGAAVSIASLMEADIHVVHITAEPLPERELASKLHLSPSDLRGNIVFHQPDGDVVQTIVSLTAPEHMKMVVMASHGHTYDPEALLGHIGMGIIQSSPDPVMVIRPDMKTLPDASWKPGRMLVPLNGSPAAAAAMDTILDLAEMIGASIDIVHIAEMGKQPPKEEGALTSPRYLDYPYYEWEAWADEFLTRFARRPPKVELRMFHRDGVPSREMLNMAAKSEEDIIVLAWQGILAGDRASTIKQILRRTEVPVILIKSG
jgi:nucleotide-binding universal stress UspA family protein